MKHICNCGFTTTNWRTYLRHIRTNGEGHYNANIAYGHLLLRGFPEDEAEIKRLRELTKGCD